MSEEKDAFKDLFEAEVDNAEKARAALIETSLKENKKKLWTLFKNAVKTGDDSAKKTAADTTAIMTRTGELRGVKSFEGPWILIFNSIDALAKIRSDISKLEEATRLKGLIFGAVNGVIVHYVVSGLAIRADIIKSTILSMFSTLRGKLEGYGFDKDGTFTKELVEKRVKIVARKYGKKMTPFSKELLLKIARTMG